MERDELGRLLPGHKVSAVSRRNRDHDMLRMATLLAASEAGKIIAIQKAAQASEEGTELINPVLYEGSGLVTYLVHQAVENPQSFMPLLGKMAPAPKNDSADEERPIEITVRIGGAHVE
jgi:hypothetical protein